MNISAIQLWLKELILHCSSTVRYASVILGIIAVLTLWYFICYKPCALHIKVQRGFIAQCERKKATLEKRLAHAAEVRNELELIQQQCRAARAQLPSDWQSPDITLCELIGKHTLRLISKKQVSKKYLDYHGVGIVLYEHVLRGTYEQIAQFFKDLTTAVPAPYCDNLIIERADKGLMCTCIFSGLQAGEP